MSYELVAKLPEAEKVVIHEFKLRGIRTNLLKVPKKKPEFACYMRPSDGRDLRLAYGKTSEDALNRCVAILKECYADLFASK